MSEIAKENTMLPDETTYGDESMSGYKLDTTTMPEPELKLTTMKPTTTMSTPPTPMSMPTSTQGGPVINLSTLHKQVQTIQGLLVNLSNNITTLSMQKGGRKNTKRGKKSKRRMTNKK